MRCRGHLFVMVASLGTSKIGFPAGGSAARHPEFCVFMPRPSCSCARFGILSLPMQGTHARPPPERVAPPYIPMPTAPPAAAAPRHAAILNVFGGVLIWKRKAEEALERSGMNYVIVRPGGWQTDSGPWSGAGGTALAFVSHSAFCGFLQMWRCACCVVCATAPVQGRPGCVCRHHAQSAQAGAAATLLCPAVLN